ncbi:MAG: acetyl esterase [Arenicella sp.]|jgi:acetyl esterase
MCNTILSDPRIDPRIKKAFGAMPPTPKDYENREQMTEDANAALATTTDNPCRVMQDACDTGDISPSARLTFRALNIASAPDGNTINIHFIRPDDDRALGADP